MSAFFEGLVFGLVLTVMAGPILFALLQAGIEQGFRAGMMVALGVFASDVLFVSMVYFGLSYILAIIELDGFELTLGTIGGVALIGIGIGTLLSKPPHLPNDYFLEKNKPPTAITQQSIYKKSSYLSLWTKGFLVNTINPFTFFFWGVVATGKMAESNFNKDDFFYFFGGILFTTLSSDSLKVYLAKIIRKKLTPHHVLWVRKISGIAFVIFGIILIIRVLF